MGLDMYLEKRSYVWNWKHSPDSSYTVTVRLNGVDRADIKPERVKYVVEEVAYWRKANAIHKWFIDNVQEGKDDCGQYDVSRKDLQKLLQDIISVLNCRESAGEKLPAEGGFFFGGTEYGGNYFDDLEYTKSILAEILKEDPNGSIDYIYHSSW